MANESAIRCCTSATKDFKTVLFRSEHEGLSFLTITLPEFGKDFQKSLDQGQVDRRLFSSFKRKGELPRFLGGFLDRVFDRASGRLLDEPCIDSILAIRQLSLMFGKIEIPCSDARVSRAMRAYVQCEQDVRVSDRRLSPVDSEAFCRISDMLFRRMFTQVDRKIYYEGILPKHGPGSTADNLVGNRKYRQTTWTARLEKVFPFGEYLFPSHSYNYLYDEIDVLEPGQEQPVKVIPVPKTLKTPRIIAKEPTCMQYVQQGILELINEGFIQDDFLRDSVSSHSQTPNQRAAERGSLDGSLATLDLSEASDRVSNQLVRLLLRNHGTLSAAVDASRSRKADVPGHGVIRLAKFASMGSALCFPFEAMVFLTVCLVGIEQQLNRPLSPRDLHDLKGRVRVYGDDIIVPVEYVHSVVSSLEHFGAKVNVNKSFWTGRFRESCGKEFFAGHDVSIVKVRQEFPARRTNATQITSLVSFRNQLYFAGYWATCRWLDSEITRILKYYPVVSPESPVLGRHSFLGYESQRMCARLHRPLVKGYVGSSVIPKNSLLDHHGALVKHFLNRSESPTEDKEHLVRSGRPRVVNIKLGWFPPY